MVVVETNQSWLEAESIPGAPPKVELVAQFGMEYIGLLGALEPAGHVPMVGARSRLYH